MSTFKMGCKNLIVFTALLLVWKVCRVYGQAAQVEYITQPSISSVATTVQATPQPIVSAIYTPVIPPCDCYNCFSGYSNYAPSYPQPMPPIIIEDDDDDNWHHILYFLLFAMRNKRNCGSGNLDGCSGGFNGGCGCGGRCNGGCGGYNGGYNGGCGCGKCCCCGCGNCGESCCSYIPYPIPYPYSLPGFRGYPDNCIEDTYQPGQGTNDINLYIRTDSSFS